MLKRLLIDIIMYRWLLMLCCNITYCSFGIINHHNRNSLFALSFLVSQQGVKTIVFCTICVVILCNLSVFS